MDSSRCISLQQQWTAIGKHHASESAGLGKAVDKGTRHYRYWGASGETVAAQDQSDVLKLQQNAAQMQLCTMLSKNSTQQPSMAHNTILRLLQSMHINW